jgi:ABC-type transport system involved in multi-copper enzyme maturation permease subunit
MEKATPLADKLMLLQAVILTACVVGFGVFLSSTVNPSWAGPMCSFAFLMLLCTAAPFVQWFNTYVYLHCSCSPSPHHPAASR